MQKILDMLMDASSEIKANHRYACGVESRPVMEGKGIRVFFLSQDGQDGELHALLRKKGMEDAGYNAPYLWMVKDPDSNWVISYTEGDVDVYELKK